MKDEGIALEKAVDKLRTVKAKKEPAAALFSLRDHMTGRKKGSQEVITMLDPSSNVEIHDPAHLKEISLQYCRDLLSNRSPRRGFEDDILMKNLIHEIRIKMKVPNDVCLTREMFDHSIKELYEKNKHKYQFILRGGKDLHDTLFKLLEQVWLTEQKPEQWRKTSIIQLYKGKGEKNKFANQRYIHTKDEVPKLFGHIVMSQVKSKLETGMTKFQIGTKTGHRAQEHIFTLKSIISIYSKFNMPMIVQLYDISKFFDKESLRDGLDAIYNLGIRGKLYNLLYMLNKDNLIKVKTTVGFTNEVNCET